MHSTRFKLCLPPHRLVNTEKRFYNKLLRLSNTSNNLIKSFTLGVITHYICDYFCYAHNIKSLGIKHRKYENNLFKYYKEHINELENSYENIKDVLKENTQKILLNNKDKHFDLILEQIKYMNNYYMKKAGTLIDNNWIYKLTQLQLDNQFSTFMVEYVTFNII